MTEQEAKPESKAGRLATGAGSAPTGDTRPAYPKHEYVIEYGDGPNHSPTGVCAVCHDDESGPQHWVAKPEERCLSCEALHRLHHNTLPWEREPAAPSPAPEQDTLDSNDHRIRWPDGGFWVRPDHNVDTWTIRAYCETCERMVTIKER